MTLSRDAKDQERLIDCVRRALAAMDAGEAVDPTAICGADTHLVVPLAEVLGLAAELPGLQQAARSGDPLAGLVLAGRYRLEHCLGRGAMGVVYRAEDVELRRQVAVKILDARLFRDPQAEQRFAREAEALAALQHENVVTVHDRGATPEGIHFLVMELLQGATLAAVLERITDGGDAVAVAAAAGVREPVWTRVVAQWGHGIAEALAVAHAHGLVHRDVKPSNVFVRADGRVVLLDFGIAAHSSSERLTATMTTLGTPWYMAPEQVRAGGLVTALPTLDVYGLGATLYHLLAGRPPYEGDAAAVLASLQTRDATPLLAVRPDTPRDLAAIVEHCLERDPAARYPTAAALAQDLAAFLAHGTVSVRPLSPFARRLRAFRRAPAKPIAVAAVLLALLVAAIAWPIGREQHARSVARQKGELYATLPSLLAIEGWPDERVLVTDENRKAIALLDRILDLDDDDLSARLFRALLRLDQGEREGAAADVRAIADRHAGGYLAGLAQRYLAADAAKKGAFAVDVTGLPAPVTPEELYTAGVHELRARQVKGFAQRADDLLGRAAAAGYLPARDFRMFAIAALADGATGDAKDKLVQSLYDETVALEEVYGRDTARTQAMRGVALTLRKQYGDAVACFERSLALRPERHGPHQNLGICYLRLGRFADSERHLQEALRLRPFAWNTKYTLAQLAQARGDFAAAYAWAEQVPTDDPNCKPWARANLIGNIATEEAIVLRSADEEAARAAATRAVAAFDAALAVVPGSETLKRRRQLAVAMLAGSLADALVDYTRMLMETEPDGPFQLRNVAMLLPSDLAAREVAWLAAYLRTLAAERAGGNEALRASLRADIDRELSPYR